MLSIALPQDLEAKLQTLAEETGDAISEHVRNAIIQYFLDLEDDRQDIESAKSALEEVERNGGTITLDDLEQELGLHGSQ